ncbi:MAG: hypothetical protein EOP83_30600 [Verrucomicrobiaceae bacterium]|nr:MAG: hypothetical protein EOP83_30600 [Verrucomicrobiaceae bacterium]
MPKSHSDLAIEAAILFLRDKFEMSAVEEVELSDMVTYHRESGVRAFWVDFVIHKAEGDNLALKPYAAGALFGWERADGSWNCSRFVMLP